MQHSRLHSRTLPTFARSLALTTLGVWICLASFGAHRAGGAETMELRLRILWGGGEARVWRASLAFPAGQLSAVQGLSLEADSPGSAFVDATGVLRVAPLSPTSYGGVDVTVRGPSDARLALELTPADRPTQFSRIELTLAELVRDFHNRELDERGNRLIVRRAPGDALRFDFERDSLVFATEEVFAFQVTPHHAGIAPGTALRAVVQLHPARGTSSLWSYEQELTVAADGSLPAITPEALLLPKLEGAYDITVSLHPRTLTDKLRRPKPLLQRKVQVVVVDDRPAPLDPADWESVGEIDPTSETWWDRLALLPGFTRLPGYAPEPLGNNAATRFREGGIDCLRLEQGGWQAYPLPIAKKGVPHILEVEFPTGSPHTLGISIVEPDAAGSVGPIGLDSGVEVPVTLAPATSPLGVHRIVFWPRTDSPFVLLTNRGQSGPAMFGKLRVLSGPRTLPPASLAATSAGANSGTTAASIDERQLMAYFEKPLFNDNFMAGEALDEYTGRSLDDWQTCLDGARRFVEYLRYAGYNSAMVTVACDGSSIYPSRLLAPTGKYDNGMFFYTGQDPMRKDVLELLFRLFDREGMKLVPTVQFAAPLPALEAIKRQGAAAADGLELIGPEGRTWVASRGAQRGLAPYYNPLDDRVQQAMRNVVRELVERYDTHASFDGLAIQLEPDSYALLPGEPWGYDNRTLRRFVEESKSQLPDEAWRNFSARVDYLLGDGRSRWLDWRVENLTNFYRGLRDELVRRRPGAKLYLNASGMFSAASVRNQLLPKLPAQPAIAEALRLHGVDLSSFASDASIVAPQPSRQAPLDSPAGRLLDVGINESLDVDRYFGDAEAATLFYHETSPLRVPGFDAASPFGAGSTQTWLLAQISPALEHNRRRFVHAIAQHDSRVLIDGGWMLSLGQEQSTRELLAAFRSLPNRPFETVKPAGAEANRQPLTVRRLTLGGRTFLYIVNDFPWPVTAELELLAPPNVQLRPLGERRLPALAQTPAGPRWMLNLAPYDFIAVELNAPNVSVRDWSVRIDPSVPLRLRTEVRQVRARANLLVNPPPYDAVPNPGFEEGVGGQVPGWVFARGDGVSVELDASDPHRGQQSLHIKSDGPVLWVRSEPMTPPRTGRGFVMVWLRVRDAGKQPPLRLALEARAPDGTFYRFNPVGAGTGFDVGDDWGSKPYLAPLDLPVEGLSQLRIGFDLMGPGELWIDDVQLHHLYFHDFDASKPSERTELRKQIAGADYLLDENRLGDCLHFVDGYWARYLNLHVPAPASRLATEPMPESEPNRSAGTETSGGSVAATPPPAAVEPTPEPPAEKPTAPAARTSRWDRMKEYLPKKLLPF